MENLYERFSRVAAANPGHIALIEGDHEITAAELLKRIDELSAWIPAGRQIGVVFDHTADLIVSLFAINKNGSLFVPCEPSFPIRRIEQMFAQADVFAILTQKKYESLFARSGFPLILIDDLKNQPKLNENPAVNSRAYVLFTSGTTGKPKGVVVRNESVLNYIEAFGQEVGVSPADRMMQYSVITFDIFIEEVFGSLLNGATLFLPDPGVRQDTEALIDSLQKNRITLLSGFPYLAEELNERDFKPESLRYLISGGDVLRYTQVNRLLERIPVLNTYGPSETTVCASYYPVKAEEVLEDGTFPIGTPIQNVQMEIRNADNQPVAEGETGEIVILGKGVSDGYIQPVKESRNFEEGRVYHSGDLGYKIGDRFYFTGRADRQIMVDGRRVELDEVESVLYQMDGIREAIVLTRDKNHHVSMVAFVSGSRSAQEIESHLQDLLPAYMIPEIRVLDHLPRNANGKPDGKVLHDLL